MAQRAHGKIHFSKKQRTKYFLLMLRWFNNSQTPQNSTHNSSRRIRFSILSSSSAFQQASFILERRDTHRVARVHLLTTRTLSGTNLCSAGAGNGEEPVAIAGSLVVVRPVSMCPIKSLANKPESGHASECSRLTERSYQLPLVTVGTKTTVGSEGTLTVTLRDPNPYALSVRRKWHEP